MKILDQGFEKLEPQHDRQIHRGT